MSLYKPVSRGKKIHSPLIYWGGKRNLEVLNRKVSKYCLGHFRKTLLIMTIHKMIIINLCIDWICFVPSVILVLLIKLYSRTLLVASVIMMKQNLNEFKCQFLLAAKPQLADRESHESLVTLTSVAFNLFVQTFSSLSLTHKSKQQPFSAPLITPADRVTGLVPLWACSVIHLLILIFFFSFLFGQFVCGQRMNWGVKMESNR